MMRFKIDSKNKEDFILLKQCTVRASFKINSKNEEGEAKPLLF